MASLASFRGSLASLAPRAFLSLAGLVALGALTGCSGSTTDPDLPSPANPLDSEESAVMSALNSLRAQDGLPTIKTCTSLNVSASAHSDDMRNNAYLSDVPPNDPTSTVRTRACAAGYTPSCTGTIPMAELVAQGYGTGTMTLDQWAADMTAGPILKQANLLVGGVGRSMGADNEYWSLDLASTDDPSCN